MRLPCRINALDYLLKPISYTDFLDAANKALQWFEMQRNNSNKSIGYSTSQNEIDSIYVKSDYKLLQVMLHDILYIEGLKDYVKIHIESQARPILSLMSLKAMEDLLPTTHFIRVHRSFIVHKEKITIIDRNRIVFGHTYIPIGESYKNSFQAYLDKHTSNL